MSQKIVTIGGAEFELSVSGSGADRVVHAEGDIPVTIRAVRENEADLVVRGRHVTVPFVKDGSTLRFFLDGDVYSATVEAKGRGRKRQKDHSMSAPMPGLVLRINVAPGDTVTKGATLVILEAMKMEHQITAPRDGRVAAVHCTAGELVQPGVDLVTFEPEAQA